MSQKHKDLKSISIDSGLITIVSQFAKLAINAAGMIILARLLAPSEHGLVAIVLTISGFLVVFRDAGLPQATIAKQDLSNAQVTNVFWLNFCFAGVMALILILLAPIMSWLYGDKRLLPITLVLSTSYIMWGATAQHFALLKREMRFALLAGIEVCSALLANFTGILAALAGAGYWSLVIIPVTLSASSACLGWFLSDWRPGLPKRGAKVTEIIRFSAHITAFDIVNYFARNGDNLIIGKMFGPAALGVYAKAYQLFMLPLSQIKGPIVNVAYPALCRLQHDDIKYRAYYCRFLEVLAFATVPMGAILFVCSGPLVQLLLGPNWKEVVPILRVLAIAGIMQSVETTRGMVMLSQNQSDKYFKYGLARSFYTVASFLIGTRWGPLGVATAYVIAGYISLVPSLAYSFNNTPIRVKDFFASVFHPFIAGAASMVLADTLLKTLETSLLLRLLLGIASVLTLYFTILACSSGGRLILSRMLSYTRIATATPILHLFSSFSLRIIKSLQYHFGSRRLRRDFLVRYHKLRSLFSNITLPPIGAAENLYSQNLDRGMHLWVVHDERWTRIIHRAHHRKLILKGAEVAVGDDFPNYEHPDVQIDHANSFTIKGDALTSDEWLYMFLSPETFSWKNFRWEFQFRQDSPFCEIQFGFRYRDFYNRYRFRIQDDYLSYDIVERGEFLNSIRSVPCSLDLGKWYDIRIEVFEDTFAFNLNGKQLLVDFDEQNRFREGSVAIVLWDPNNRPISAGIRNITVDRTLPLQGNAICAEKGIFNEGTYNWSRLQQ